MYNRLADFIIENLDIHDISVILEVGCGKGQLTIPLAEKLKENIKDFKIIAFDACTRPYKGVLDTLKGKIQRRGLDKNIVIVEGDVRNMNTINDESVGFIISNELFCDLNREGLLKALEEFYRILKPNGQMAHGELNSIPENPAQNLLIKSDSYSVETVTSQYEWFSPFSDEVAAFMHKIGFKDILVKYFETAVHLPFNNAIKQLKEWNIELGFIEKHKNDLKKHGLEFPIEHVIFCRK